MHINTDNYKIKYNMFITKKEIMNQFIEEVLKPEDAEMMENVDLIIKGITDVYDDKVPEEKNLYNYYYIMGATYMAGIKRAGSLDEMVCKYDPTGEFEQGKPNASNLAVGMTVKYNGALENDIDYWEYIKDQRNPWFYNRDLVIAGIRHVPGGTTVVDLTCNILRSTIEVDPTSLFFSKYDNKGILIKQETLRKGILKTSSGREIFLDDLIIEDED